MHGDFRRRVVAGREAGIADSLQYLHPARGRFQAFAEGSRVALPVAISVNHGLNESHKELTLSTFATLSPCPGVDGEINHLQYILWSRLRRTTDQSFVW